MPSSLDHCDASTQMGANLIANGATFRVWAPNASSVHVRGTFNNFELREGGSLVRGENGYWCGFISDVKDCDRYKYFINGPAGPGWKRDPYARELGGAEWNSVVRSTKFPWHETGFQTPAFHNFLIYQLHVGAFVIPSGAPHFGTFLDVIDKIPYLVDLGVSVLQLLPIKEFPGNFGLGYNGTDYFSPEMAYVVDDARLPSYVLRANALLARKGLTPYSETDLKGEMNQLKALVDLCHAHGLAVIFDLVFNHAGGAFGTESLWFFDRQQGADGIPPLWWNSLYFSDKTWSGGNVFNFQSEPVRAFLIDNAKFFFDEFRVDGFRFDEVSVIDSEGRGRGWDFCQELTGTLREHRPNALLHAEYWNVNPWVVKEREDGGAGFHTTMTNGPRIALREVLRVASDPNSGALPITNLASQLGLEYLRARWRGVNSIENHDLVLRPKDENDHGRMDRIARVSDPTNPRSWYARSRARIATGLLLTMPGIPMMFMGQEFLEDKQWSDDVDGHRELLIYWDGLASPDPTMRDFLLFTRELIRTRWQLPALRGEGFSIFHAHDENRVLAFQRWVPGEGRNVVVILNFANETKYGYKIGFPIGGYWREVFNSDVYDNWVNPQVQGNGGGTETYAAPLHGLPFSAALTLPANSLIVFAQ